MTTTPPRWTCACCFDHHNDYTSIDVNKFKMCTTCVKGMFERAIKHEIDYSAIVTLTELHPKHFDHIISSEFVERYVQREKEYKCPTSSRAYCKHFTLGGSKESNAEACGKFVGPLRQEEKEVVLIVASCGGCSRLTCLKCGVELTSIEQSPAHDCEKRITEAKIAETEEIERAFAGLELGKDFQRCPNEPCSRPIQLGEACNHLTCTYCQTSFCFVCGTLQEEGSDHWFRGGCPRYNLPGESNAGYDGEGGYGGDGWGGGTPSPPPSPVIRARAASNAGWGNDGRAQSPTPSMREADTVNTLVAARERRRRAIENGAWG
ncbi:hypothetical protein LTR56_004254 [Elasticomyces elasticus]|nr:hypothetical protein LTR56_004254 [Elasticomyces elasticus]KAK3655143.1 hypothetical protein LTR22_010453 [Elasticomyces elasticus]KAK4904565.1 hypothetical protein LTR49_026009 [Elasticomyces elasticus]KAK5750591.1 hypothetical protein LTS12_019381 [Elasticomyces elasticus]